MARIKSVNTKPELRVRQLLHSMGYRFRLHRRDLPGSPDVVLPRLRAAIYVHGCFWHQHSGCRLARQPKTRLEYWLPKLARNIARDIQALQDVAKQGWHPLVVWECETKAHEALEVTLRAWLTKLPEP